MGWSALTVPGRQTKEEEEEEKLAEDEEEEDNLIECCLSLSRTEDSDQYT